MTSSESSSSSATSNTMEDTVQNIESAEEVTNSSRSENSGSHSHSTSHSTSHSHYDSHSNTHTEPTNLSDEIHHEAEHHISTSSSSRNLADIESTNNTHNEANMIASIPVESPQSPASQPTLPPAVRHGSATTASAITATNSTPPGLELTLLLISGLRVTVRLDDHYITSHSLNVGRPEFITVGSFKSTLFSSWQDEWGSVPTSSAFIRLIHLGKILEDQQTLEECNILSSKPHNVVHLSVKPESFELEVPAKVKTRGGFRGSRSSDSVEGHNRSSGSCCIIL